MVKEFYKVYFWATELKHGKEETRLHAVYMPRFDENGKHIDEARRIERGASALTSAHFYNIKYGSTIATELVFG